MNTFMQKLGLLATILSTFLSASAYDFKVGGIYYNITNPTAKEVEVTYEEKYGSPSTYSGNIIVPTSVSYSNEQYTVTEIGDMAFHNCSSLTSITIPNSVTTIGDYAFFDCSGLESITIPNSVTTIGDGAFSSCRNLTSITIPNSVTTIGWYAFSGCSSLTSITIPNSVTSIGESAFPGCSNLTSITIPNSVTTIGDMAFCNCRSLTSIDVDTDNSEYSSIDGILYDKSQTTLICCPGGKAGDFIIPNSVTSIGYGAFHSCSSLTSITIPNSVTTIGDYTFGYCSSLTSITIPNSVTTIGDYTFGYCSSLTSITIPNSVTEIGKNAFYNCSSLTSITIPNFVTAIGDEAFYGCSSLTSITIPGSVTVIGTNVFRETENLREIYWYCNCQYEGTMPADKVYTFRECYSGENAIYLDFLQPQHITPLKAGVAIDYSERFGRFDVEGYEIKSLKVTNTDGNTIADVPLNNDGIYKIKLHDVPFHVSMTYFDPRAERDVITTVGPYAIQSSELLTFRNVTTTESTASFEYEFHEDASTDFSEFELTGIGADKVVSSKKGKLTFTKLYPNEVYSGVADIRFKDGREFEVAVPTLRTKNLVFYRDFERVTPTAIELDWHYDAGDAADQISEVTFDVPENEMSYGDVKGNEFHYLGTSLPLGQTVKVAYNVYAQGRELPFCSEAEFTLPELVLNTVAAMATSNDCAIICAETNMSEYETGGGFEWRRYDAPDMVPSTFVNCPVNNGMMAGKLKGLSSGTYYKYRPFYEDMYGHKTYGEWTAFITADAYVYFEPTVYTYEPTAVTGTSARIIGYALGGSDDVTEQGFEYRAASGGSRAEAEAVRVPATGTRMSVTLTELTPGTTYIVRAYAATAKATTYGEEKRFTTAEEQNAIEVVEIEEPAAFDVYTLSGACVRRNATDLRGLRPGIYIANGRKVIVR